MVRAATGPQSRGPPVSGSERRRAGSSEVEHVTFNHVVEGSIPSPLTTSSHRDFGAAAAFLTVLALVLSGDARADNALPFRETESRAEQATPPGEPPTAWQIRKCEVFAEAWSKALPSYPANDVSASFIADNQHFIAVTCRSNAAICPQSASEIAIANRLTFATMNAGAASSFVPYRCPSLRN